jgi:hypothetical protein
MIIAIRRKKSKERRGAEAAEKEESGMERYLKTGGKL